MYPKFSIITINLNNLGGLQRTLSSVETQTLVDFEYIIIDGGSTDGSITAIENFRDLQTSKQNTFPFHSLSEPDTGIYNAMNKGIARASGEYCFFLNSGDFFASHEVLQKVKESKPDEDIVFGNLLVGKNDKIFEKAVGKKQLTFFDIYLSSLKHQSTFIRRDLFEKFGIYNDSLKIVADFEYFLKTVGLKNASYRYIDLDIAFFDNDGISNQFAETIQRERKQVLENNIPSIILSDYREFEKYQFLKPAFQYRLSRFALKVIAKCAKEYGKIVKYDS